MKESEKNIHKGHRRRLLDTVFKIGIDDLSNVQAMEFILFYIFPRGNVNPLAHRLLDRYKNIPTILEAPVYDLVKVEGMGETSAKKLSLLLNIYYRYTQEKAAKQEKISTFGEIYDFIEALLRFKHREEIHVIAVNRGGRVLGTRCLARGTISLVAINLNEIALFVSAFNASGVIIVHNHPGGSCTPSAQDMESHQKLVGNFEFVCCDLVDDAIIGSDGIYSMKDNCLKRAFVENQEYYDMAIEELKSLKSDDNQE